jgi:hypothetical protein
MFSGLPDKMADFRDAFTRLKERFTITSSIHATFVSSRTQDLAEDLSESTVYHAKETDPLIDCSEEGEA